MTFFEQKEVCPKLGLEINNIDLNHSILNDKKKILLNLLDTYHLLIIKKQTLSEKKLIEISNIFGEPAPALVPTFRLKDYPLITKHTNSKDEHNLPIGVIAPEYVFHADSYFTANPNKATLFYSLESPEYGGETHFVNMCYAYDSLDNSIKEFINDKKAIYKNAYINQPPVIHPLVRIHPRTQQKALFANIHRALGISDVESNDALALLSNLYDHATKPDNVYKHRWEDGDLLIWSNITTMHCATKIQSNQKRLLYRVLIQGDIPVV